MPRHPAAPNRNRVPASAVYDLLGFPSVQAMDHVRRRMQQIADRATGAIIPAAQAVGHIPGEPREARRRREVELEHGAMLVVPEWGAIKWPGSSWTYDLQRCTALAEGGVGVLLRAAAEGQDDLRDG